MVNPSRTKKISATHIQWPCIILAASMVMTVAAYWIGLRGPFLMDDASAFRSLQLWARGDIALPQVLFGNSSWLMHRSLAMASFALNTWIFGFTPFGFKLGNLLLHLAVGLAAYGWLAAMLPRDPFFNNRPRLVAALIVAVWLLHPLHASTVLYAVQRMAQWAALCCLLGMWLYVVVRQRIEFCPARRWWVILYVGIAALTFLGIQGKQNAIVLPGLCLAIELAYFRRPNSWPRQLTAFYALFIAIPAALATTAFVIKPSLLMYGYGEYTFSAWQRLLTEGRVLLDYLRLLFVPYTPSMGLTTDDYVASIDILHPPTTLVSWLTILGISGLAWRLSIRLPAFFLGWFLFLIGHTVESTILGLELYYEHRNYLPSFGIILIAAMLVVLAGRRLASRGIRVGRVGIAAVSALSLMLMLQTLGRSHVWSDGYLLAESDLANHPKSVRATVTYMGAALAAGDAKRAYEVADQVIRSTDDARQRALTRLARIRMDCTTKGRASSDDLLGAASEMPGHIDVQTNLVIDSIYVGMRNGCDGIGFKEMADALRIIADQPTTQSPDSMPRWMVRYRAAYFYARVGYWPEALAQARLAWQPSTNSARAPLLVAIMLRNGQTTEAQQLMKQAISRAIPGSDTDVQAIARIRAMLARPRPEIRLGELVGESRTPAKAEESQEQ